MAIQNAGYVGPQVGTDGGSLVARQDRTGAQVVVEGGGKWQEAARLGYLWSGQTAVAGVNIPIYTSTTQQFVISNPAASGKAMILKSYQLGYVSGTPVVGFTMIIGSNVPNATPPSGTAGLQFNHKTGAVTGSSMTVLGSTVTVVAATWYRPSLSTYLTTAGTTTIFAGEEIDGSIIVTPGGWIGIAANAAAFGTHMVSMTWAEVPVGLVS